MRSLITLALLLVPSLASAATYVDTPPLGRTTAGVSLYGGTPLGEGATLGGGGSEAMFGYAWLSGFSLHGVVGGARWSSKGALAQTFHDGDVIMLEGYAGLHARYAFFDSEVSPFIGCMALADAARVHGSAATGFVTGGQLGLRWHDVPWDVWAAVDVRRATLATDDDRFATMRLAIVLGAAFESGLR